jgi:putative ABC transport system permease protein
LTPAVVGALLRRVRAEREMALVVFTTIALTSFVFAAVPRLFNHMADDGLSYSIAHASTYARNIQMLRADVLPPPVNGDSFAQIVTYGDDFRSQLAPSIQAIIGDQKFVIDSARNKVVDDPAQPPYPSPRFVTLRYQQDIDRHIKLTEGRMPAATTERVPVPGIEPATDAPVYEIAVSAETARQLGVKLGDQLILLPASDDPLVRRIPLDTLTYMAVRFVGFIELPDPTEEFWLGDPRLDRAMEFDDGNVVQIFATALISPDAIPQMRTSTATPFQFTWRYFVDPDRVSAGTFNQLAADMRRLDAEYGVSLSNPFQPSVRTGLTGVLNAYLGQRNLTEAVLSLTTIALLAVALAVIALIAALVAARRRDALIIVRGRGGSAGQILGAQAVEVLLVGIPAGIVGYLLATLLIPGRSSIWSIVAAAGIVVATGLLLLAATMPVARRSLGELESRGGDTERTSMRRLVFEALVAALALAGVYLLRRRGLSGDSATSEISGLDPYLAAVPVLLGLATGLVVIRLYSLPVHLFAWLAALRRDLVPVTGFRRTSRQPSAARLPMLVLLLSLAVAVFSSVILSTISTGQVESSWQRVGADYRVTSSGEGYLYRGVNLSQVPGVEAVASAFVQPDAVFASRSPVFGSAQFLAVETQKLEDVNRGTPAAPHFPSDMLKDPTGTDIGKPTNPIPAVVSRTVGDRALSPGTTFGVTIAGHDVTFIAVDVRDRFPGLDVGRAFIVAPLASVQTFNPNRPVRPTDLFIRAPERAFATLRATLNSQTQAAALTSRARVYAEVHDAPLISGVATGFRFGLILTALYAGAAILVALILTGRARARDLAYLRTLGLSRQQALALTVVEQGPPTLLALGTGAVLGVVVARLIEPGVDLTAFTGPGIPVPLLVSWPTVVGLALLLLLVVTVAIALTHRFAARIGLSQVLRLGDQ